MKKPLFIAFVITLFLCGAIGLALRFNAPEEQVVASSKKWWTDAVFYEIYVRAFSDSDQDGIGDFNGITQKLDYLQNLGVTAIWLMPIHPASSDHGYDVVDYLAVNPDYGSIDDFKNLLQEAHKRNISIIIDMVVNHTSNKHPFFLSAQDDPNAPYRNWYVWSDAKTSRSWHPAGKSYYYSAFSKALPDLNYRNPEVRAYVIKVLQYWLAEVGVDGFRFDAVRYFVEQNDQFEDTQANHHLLQSLHDSMVTAHPDVYTVGEVADPRSTVSAQYVGQFTQIFSFDLAQGFVESAASGNKSAVEQAYSSTLKNMPNGSYATFLSSHDQDRVLSRTNGNEDKARVAASLLFTAPGTPFIYYGDELGMRGYDTDASNRLSLRYAQSQQNSALWNHYQKLIQLRRKTPALNAGGATVVATDSPAVFSLIRLTGTEQVLVLINLGESGITNYNLSLPASLLEKGEYVFESLLGDLAGSVTVDEDGGFATAIATQLKPFETVIVHLRKK